MKKYLTNICNIESLLSKNEILTAREKIEELKEILAYDIAIKNAKIHKKEQLSSAKQFLANAKKNRTSVTLFHKIYKIDDTFQMCDGYTAIVLNDMIDGLELNTEKGNYLDCRNVINSCNHTGCNYEKVEIDILELEKKAIMAKATKENPIPFQYASKIEDVYCNPIYLLRAIKILGKENVDIYVNTSSQTEPIYLQSGLGEAIVLPIKPPKK